MSKEIWKDLVIDNEVTKYKVSNFGQVKNSETGRILSQYISDGKLKVTLVVNTALRYDSTFAVDRLVLETFRNEVFEPGKIVYYMDGDPYNLHIDNLDYITYEEYLRRIVLKVFKSEEDHYILKDYNLHKDEKWKFIYIKDKMSNYLVSNYGHVFNILSGLYLNPSFGTHGYAFITLRGGNGKTVKYDMHRLVATYFVHNPDPETKIYVHHKNHNRGDCIYTNLEWVSPSENNMESVEYNSMSGVNSKNAKITEDDARQICQMLQDGYRVSQIAYTIGCNRSTVRHIKDRTSWKHISKDYSFDNTYSAFIDSKILDSVKYLLKRGVRSAEIKRILNVSTNTVSKINSQGYSFILNIKEIIRMNIMIMHKKGYSDNEISDILGVTKSYIQNVIIYYEKQELNL